MMKLALLSYCMYVLYVLGSHKVIVKFLLEQFCFSVLAVSLNSTSSIQPRAGLAILGGGGGGGGRRGDEVIIINLNFK